VAHILINLFWPKMLQKLLYLTILLILVLGKSLATSELPKEVLQSSTISPPRPKALFNLDYDVISSYTFSGALTQISSTKINNSSGTATFNIGNSIFGCTWRPRLKVSFDDSSSSSLEVTLDQFPDMAK